MMHISVLKYDKLTKRLHQMNKDAENVVKKTVSDFKSRAPAWVSAAVTETYGISKSDVKSAFKGAKKISGTVRTSNTEVDNIGLEYVGRVLTATHFKMKPAALPAKKGIPYQVSAEIFKGQRKVLASDAFLGNNKYGKLIPFQRVGAARLPIISIKTLSIPQMLTNETVAANIQQNIEAGLGKRVENHMNQALNRASK